MAQNYIILSLYVYRFSLRLSFTILPPIFEWRKMDPVIYDTMPISLPQLIKKNETHILVY